jgi:hypothetical protein
MDTIYELAEFEMPPLPIKTLLTPVDIAEPILELPIMTFSEELAFRVEDAVVEPITVFNEPAVGYKL